MKSRKLVKILGASGLAIMMGIGTLCGVLIAPMKSTHANTSANTTTETALTPKEQAKAELDANILAGGGLGLDPENDPIVYTTDWGLDIKFHNDWGSFGTSANSGGVAGYCYFTMGSYSGTAVNWVIIGRSSNVVQSFYCTGQFTNLGTKYQNYTLPNYVTHSTTNSNYYKNNQHETSSDAGSAILGAGAKGLVYDFQYVLFANSVMNSEIPSNCVLCISEKVLYQDVFTYTEGNMNYSGSKLQTIFANLYSTNLGLTSSQKSYIQSQSLTTYYCEATRGGYQRTSSSVSNQYLFALAFNTKWPPSSYPQQYCVESYLGDNNKRIAYQLGSTTAKTWWTRSGYYSGAYHGYFISTTGGYGTNSGGSGAHSISQGVRPAFVLKL